MADNIELWNSLGMDLETHDMLCNVLPQAFGDVFLSQENRPEGMAFWDAVTADIHGIRAHELVAAQAEGRKVFGTFCVYVPDEIVVACNGIVTGLCGGSQFWVPDGEKVLPANLCPLIKASVGARLGRTCPYFRIADMYVGENTCDGKKKAYEILGKDVPMHIMDIPQMKRTKDYKAWEQEIAEFAKVVEDVTGVELTVDNLNKAIKVINEKRRALARVYNARKNPDVIPISGADALLMMQIAFFDDPERTCRRARSAHRRWRERIPRRHQAPDDHRHPACDPQLEAAQHHRDLRRCRGLRGDVHRHPLLREPGRRRPDHPRRPVRGPVQPLHGQQLRVLHPQ